MPSARLLFYMRMESHHLNHPRPAAGHQVLLLPVPTTVCNHALRSLRHFVEQEHGAQGTFASEDATMPPQVKLTLLSPAAALDRDLILDQQVVEIGGPQAGGRRLAGAAACTSARGRCVVRGYRAARHKLCYGLLSLRDSPQAHSEKNGALSVATINCIGKQNKCSS